MYLIGWIVWILALLWGLIQLMFFLRNCLAKSLRDYVYPHERKQRLALFGFSLAMTTLGLFLSAFFDFSKLHLLWLAPIGLVGGVVLSEGLFPDPSHKQIREGAERIRRMIQDRSDVD